MNPPEKHNGFDRGIFYLPNDFSRPVKVEKAPENGAFSV